MSDLYSEARSLVKALRETKEWQRMHKLAGSVKADPASEELLAQFRRAQFEAQAAVARGRQVSAQQQATLQQLTQQIQGRALLLQYMEAENAYGAVLGEVHKVLEEVFEPDLPGEVKAW